MTRRDEHVLTRLSYVQRSVKAEMQLFQAALSNTHFLHYLGSMLC